MQEKSLTKSGPGIIALALAALVPAGVAHAAWTDTPGESGISATGYFSNFGTGANSPEINMALYDKVNLGPLSATVLVAKPGAQGPMRDDRADMVAAQYRDIEGRLGPVGGNHTP